MRSLTWATIPSRNSSMDAGRSSRKCPISASMRVSRTTSFAKVSAFMMRRSGGKSRLNLLCGQARVKGALASGARALAVMSGLLLLALAAPEAGRAQVVLGRVTNTSGNPLAGATLTLRTDSSTERSARSDSLGNYEIGDVRAGRYRLAAQQVGYARVERELRVGPGDRRRVDFRLQPERVVLEG